VFSFGSAEKGQLGNGTMGERIITGNKTGYDIEVQPGSFPLSFSSPFLSLGYRIAVLFFPLLLRLCRLTFFNGASLC
jgi:hypothetical protein